MHRSYESCSRSLWSTCMYRESLTLCVSFECLERCSPSKICSWRGPFSWPLAGIIQTFEDAKRDHPWEINIRRCAGKCWSDHSSCWRTQGWLKLLITLVRCMFEYYLNCDHFWTLSFCTEQRQMRLPTIWPVMRGKVCFHQGARRMELRVPPQVSTVTKIRNLE